MNTLQPLMAIAMAAQLSIAGAQTTAPKPYLGSLFTDNMVLQRGTKDPVWGWTTPGATVTVSIAGKSATAKAGADGKWMVKLPPLPVGGPYTLTVSGPTNVTLNNVLVGDVWICSGQSNMQMGIGVAKDAESEIAAANYPTMRLYSVPQVPSFSPVDTVNGKWDVCTPATVSAGGWGGFSAAAYYFGRELTRNLGVPIGLLHTSWGGTIAEAWTSADALNRHMPEFRQAVAQVQSAAKVTSAVDYDKLVADWFAKNDPGSAAGSNWESPSTDASSWKTMQVPKAWEETVLPDYDGVVWMRKELSLPNYYGSPEATLNLGPIDDNDVTYVNGTKVGATNDFAADRSYKIPAGVLKPGNNVIVVRVLDTGGNGGFYGKPEQMNLSIDGRDPVSLAGDWQYKASADFKKVGAFPIRMDNNPNVVTVLYNGMIAPLEPFAVKGAIWYQGEANAGRDEQYRRLLPTMIKDWRDHFGVGPFPFYIVQLASFMPEDTEPRNDDWPRLREAQYLTTKVVKNTGVATAIDIGEANDIHPKNKQEVGRRLALDALALTYGKRIEYSGPVYKSMKVEGGAVRLAFDHITGGLSVKGGAPLKGFAIAGSDGKFVWADAKIDGNAVVVWSSSVPKPVAVRYAWSNNPVANLYNGAGLPALPFRTDGPRK